MKKTIGVIGLGSIGMRHAENLISLGHTVITSDPDPNKKAGLPWDGTPRILDGVVIASPTMYHSSDIARMVGVPTFVEKPIADNLNPINITNVHMVGYNLRFHSCVIKAKEWIDKGFLGKPIWANLVCAQLNTRYTDSVILNWSHEIDLATYLLGPGSVTGCSASGSSGRDELADILLTHENGCHSTIHLDYLTQPEVRQTIIVGTDCTIIIDILNRQTWLRAASGAMMDVFEGDDTWDENYRDEMETFLARIDGKETIGCTGKEGLEVLKICLEAQQRAKLSIDDEMLKTYPAMKVNLQ